MKMHVIKNKVLWRYGLSLVALVVLGGLFLWVAAPAILSTSRSYIPGQMWSVTHEWTRTAPVPSDAWDIRIASKGSIFTRQFNAHFRASPASIKKWIADSTGFRDAQVTDEPDGVKTYVIRPGGGAMFAEISIHYSTGTVDIETYWS